MNPKLKKWSLLCFIICLLLWIPNVVFQISSPFWMLVYIVGPIGMALGVLGKSVILTILNLIMSFSFFIIMFFGYQIFAS
ncbi:hypothetical protein FFL34_01265 [Lentibacillus cibarius]|uniref:Uncharacterized protein n=1 Tax=Lentibacillus cibarius TaxID=2583219 RepID=A0A5S3QG72_9BACI|nr:hypothetical protein FFL34_01265 [Lentibacillus cibarius]